MKTEISVLIVTWNSAAHIADCLESLRATTSRNLDIVVVDNQSSDQTRDIIRSFSNVELIETGANLGFAPAMNLAMQIASRPFICLLNPDTLVSPFALDRLATFLEENRSVAAVGPRLVDENGAIVRNCARPFPSLRETVVRQFGIAKIVPEQFVIGMAMRAALLSTIPVSVPSLTGAALMFRRSSMLQVGLLDETIPMYFEDLDYCARLRKVGRIFYVPNAVIVHPGGKSADVAPVRKLLYALEKGEAPFLFMQRYDFKYSAQFFRVLTFWGSLFRLALLIPACFLARCFQLRAAKRLQRIRAQSVALLWWCVCSRQRLRDQTRRFFTEKSQSTSSPCPSGKWAEAKESTS
jgi:GT2 family glycosyltransferase